MLVRCNLGEFIQYLKKSKDVLQSHEAWGPQNNSSALSFSVQRILRSWSANLCIRSSLIVCILCPPKMQMSSYLLWRLRFLKSQINCRRMNDFPRACCETFFGIMTTFKQTQCMTTNRPIVLSWTDLLSPAHHITHVLWECISLWGSLTLHASAKQNWGFEMWTHTGKNSGDKEGAVS